MKQITVISGKGGTGKTTITASLSYLAENAVIVDCDVDASDMHLLLNPSIKNKTDFYSGKAFLIDKELCINCGLCKNKCRFNAISDEYKIDPISCEGCGACFYICPPKAITSKENLVGEYYVSEALDKQFVHAKLHIAQDNSGKLVAQIRKKARTIAENNKQDFIIIYGPPGIGCPVNAAIVGINLAVIVTEPTLSGIHDLKRIIDVTKHFRVPCTVVINKYDLNQKNCAVIEALCDKTEIKCISKIPYSLEVVKTLNDGEIIIRSRPEDTVSKEIKRIWRYIKDY